MLGGHMGHQQHNMQPQSNAKYMQQQGATGGSRGGNGQSVSPPHNHLPAGSQSPLITNMCIRQGCLKPSVSNPEWEDEYCSNECVVSHCKDVFNSWVASNKTATQSNSSAK